MSSLKKRKLYSHEYRFHVDPNTIPYIDEEEPYVNIDRSSESIGFSSWSGNLVDWFRSGFTSRIQYGIRAGLFPEDKSTA